MTSSASRKVSATTGSRSHSSRSMLTYCEPWPGNRKATLPGLPLPRKTPWEVRGFHTGEISVSSARIAFSPRLTSSSASLKSMASRSCASRSALAGAWRGGTLPARASARATLRRACRPNGLDAPSISMSRGGALGSGLLCPPWPLPRVMLAPGNEPPLAVSMPGICSSRTT